MVNARSTDNTISTDNTMAKMKKKYKQGIYWSRKTLHRKLKISQHDPDDKPGESIGVPEGQAVPAPLVLIIILQYKFSC